MKILTVLAMTKKVIKFYHARWKYRKRYHKSVSPEIFAERVGNQCCHCVFLDPKTFNCRLCDCDVRLKAEWAEEQCPDDPPRWRRIIFISDDKTMQKE